MVSNSTAEYKVAADVIVSPDNDIVVKIKGGMYKDSITEQNRYATMSDVGEGGGGGPLVVPVNVKDSEGENFITFTRTGTGTARIATPQDDLSLRSARDITLIAGDDGPGNVYIGWGDATISPDATNRVATIGDIQSLTTGDFEFNDNVMSAEDVTMNIQAKRDASTLGSTIELRPFDGLVGLYGYTSPRTDTYTAGSDWDGDAIWASHGEGGSSVYLANASGIVTFLNETFNQAPVQFVSINGSDFYPYDGLSGNSDEATIYTFPGAPEAQTIVTSLAFKYQTRSRIEIDDDDEEILIQGIGLNVNLESTGNIKFRSNLNADSVYDWEMTTDGKLQLPGDGYIENVVNGSGEGGGADTLKLVPDSTLGSDQYIIIDPTDPNHIHIRAGGDMDASNANLILGAEDNNVVVSDSTNTVTINATEKVHVYGKLQLNNSLILTAAAPANSYGQAGDLQGMVAFSSTHIYYCVADYVNNSTNIWKRVELTGGSW